MAPLNPSRLNEVQTSREKVLKEAVFHHSAAIMAMYVVAAVVGSAALLGFATRLRSQCTLRRNDDKFQRAKYLEASLEDEELGETIE